MSLKKQEAQISFVESGSLAEAAGLTAGDKIISINSNEFYDILEYRYLTSEYEVVLEVLKKNGDIEQITIENDYEDLGILFTNALITPAKSCKNKCIFCFIDQLPKGMRETVYFKDDDTRLSFLQGNYVTLTNLSDDDIDRLIKMRVSPINISVHTTNPELRVKMLNNKNAGKVYDIMKRFYENKIYMNAQIVLCKGYNDKEELDRTICDLEKLYPYVESLSVVPVGLSAHREGLCKLEAYDEESSKEVIKRVRNHQERIFKKTNKRFVYLADEFYINAKEEIPDASEYDGFPQIENGVGLIASMKEEFYDAVKYIKIKEKKREVSLITGEISKNFIKSLKNVLEEKIKGLKINVYPIKNEFFGGGVSVSGLVVGKDIINQVKGKSLGEEVFIPDCMLRDGEDVFLDDTTLDELIKELGVLVTPIMNDGYDFVEKIIKENIEF